MSFDISEAYTAYSTLTIMKYVTSAASAAMWSGSSARRALPASSLEEGVVKQSLGVAARRSVLETMQAVTEWLTRNSRLSAVVGGEGAWAAVLDHREAQGMYRNQVSATSSWCVLLSLSLKICAIT